MPNDLTVPNARAVAGRALILHYEIERIAFTSVSGIMALFSQFASEEENAEFSGGLTELVTVTIDLLKSLRLWNHLTARERRIFEAAPDQLTPEDQSIARAEADALVCLLWALGKIESLPDTSEATDGSALADILSDTDDDGAALEAFLEGAALRPEWEIAAARDAMTARLRKTALAQHATPSDDAHTAVTVLATRLKALEWVCGSLALRDWDDTTPQEL